MRTLLVNIARFITALTFVFSGFVKAVDPLGTVYKFQDYAEAVGLAGAFPEWMLTCAAIILALFEFSLGISLLFAMNRKVTAWLTMVFMAIMTILTIWIYFANPVSDCGCFGDALKLTNGQTLLKNIILSAFSAMILAWYDRMPRLVSHSNRWIVWHYSSLFIIVVAGYSLYHLPLFDFRPYHIGANIPQGMVIPEDAEQPEFETTFIMEKDGKRQEFTLENYPDSTWTFVDSKTIQTKAGYEPPIHDFSIQRVSDGTDLTDSILTAEGYTFLLISPHLEKADDSYFGNINQVCDFALDNGYGFFCLTASGKDAIERWIDLTGAEYQFCNTDEVTLQTIIRSNPGLLLLKDGTVKGKWNSRDIPTDEIVHGGKITERSTFMQKEDVTAKKLGIITMWYVLPLILLALADRLWMWSRWFRAKEDKQKDKLSKLLKNQKQNNGKENCCRQLENEQEPAGGRSSR